MKQNSRAKDFNSQIIEVRRGIYALRYVSALTGKDPPKITVETDSEAEIELIGMPGAKYATLSDPGELLVVRAFGRAQIRINVAPAYEGGSIVADVRLEDLKSISSVTTDHITSNALTPPEASKPELEILGHVRRLGDVTAASREWIAGPPAPNNIEGIRIYWTNKPPDVELLVEGVLGGRAQGKSATICSDGLIGSRGRAIPLVGLNLQLSGSGATRYNLLIESLFRGGEASKNRGRDVELKGATGSEALIGLKIEIEVLESNLGPDTVKRSGRSQIEQAAEPIRSQARVRVFKRS